MYLETLPDELIPAICSMCTYDNISCSEKKELIMLYITEEKRDTHVIGFKLISAFSKTGRII